MGEREGSMVPEDLWGKQSACSSCGGELPAHDHGLEIYEQTGDGGWEQLCTACSDGINQVEVFENGANVDSY